MYTISFKVWAIVLVCFLIGRLSSSVTAQNDECPRTTEEIAYGDNIRGEITDDTVFIFYCFQGERGDELVIDLTATDGDLDPYLLLSDVDVENFYAENDDISPRNTDSQIEYTLEEDGPYILIVTRVQGDKGTTTGEYRLQIENSVQRASSPTSRIEGGQCTPGSNMLIPGYSLSSTINDDNFLRTYCFYGTKGTEYRATVETIEGDLDTSLFVTTPDLETILVSNDNANSRTTDSRLDFVPEMDGVYLIVVTRPDLDTGDTAGDYQLSLENRTTDEPDTCPDALTFPLNGVEIPRAEETYLYVYCFNGTDNERVTFKAQAQRGNLDLAAFITTPDLETVEQDEGQDETFELEARLPQDGPYLLVVFDLTGTGRIDMTFEDGTSSESTSRGQNTLDTAMNNSGSEADENCEAEPLVFLVEGHWSSTTATSTTRMDFACNGEVSITVNGSTFETTYTFEGDTLTLALDEGDLVVEGVLLTRTALIGTNEGQAFMLLNRAR